MQRAVIDTHCLVASVGPRSPFRALYDLFADEAFEWVISNEILTEYDEILTRLYSPLTAAAVLKALAFAPNTYRQEAYYKWQLVTADPDDNKFVDVVIAAGADFLVSNDRHFVVLPKSWTGLAGYLSQRHESQTHPPSLHGRIQSRSRVSRAH